MENASPVVIGLRPPANKVSSKAILFWTIRAGGSWTVLIAAQLLWFGLDGWQGQAHVVALVVTAVLAVAHLVIMPQWRFRVHRWEITPEAVYVQAGWFNQERRIAPVSRIQTVDTERGPLDRIFGLTNITVTTASAHGPVKIHCLADADAQAVAAELLTNTRGTTGDAT